MASRRGSTLGGYSWRPSASGGQQSRRTSVASRRASTSGGISQGQGQVQGLDDVLRLMSPASAVTGAGSAAESQGGEPIVQPEIVISTIPGLFKALDHLERACVLNSYHDKVNPPLLSLSLACPFCTHSHFSSAAHRPSCIWDFLPSFLYVILRKCNDF